MPEGVEATLMSKEVNKEFKNTYLKDLKVISGRKC